jgi:hypothetical protein
MTIKSLADGQLPNSKGTLYTVGGATSTIIKKITCVNTNTTTESVNLYIKRSGSTSRRICPKDLQLAAGYMAVDDEEHALAAGDLIEGDTTTASKVDYIIEGVEKT